MIQIKNLNFSYASKKILEDINLKINPGEFVGIIGPNGSGKTTLLKNICQVLKPDKGIVLIEGRSHWRPKELAQKMAVVSENGPVDFDFTALEIVLMGRAPFLKRFEREGREDIEIAKRSMEATDTLQFMERPITELSAGERQRVFIAQCLAQMPKIILLDEPTNYLDINHKIRIFNFFSTLNKEKGVTVLSVLHDLNLASRYCDKLILMSGGKIFTTGKTAEVLTVTNIQKVYGITVIVRQDETTGRSIVLY
ncbi:MAG: ABC transporter ATP-binding protein [Candidatus Doudnabacteria bacterium]